MTTAGFIIKTAEIRLSQLRVLVDWLTAHLPEKQSELQSALAAIETAAGIIGGLERNSGSQSLN